MTIRPTPDGRPERQARIDALLASMTLPEKIGQMTQVELDSITPDDVTEWGVGSVLSGGGGSPGDGSAVAWRSHVEALVAASRRSRLGIPLLYGTDAVHGHNNVIGATIFPHNIGMGAAGDPDLMARVARAAALETAATGVRWSFAPCLAVPQDIRWGRTYEGFAADPELVAALGAAAVSGWHGQRLAVDGVLACAKHFVGEGSMAWGTAGSGRHDWIDWWDGWGPGWQIDQGDIRLDEDELRRLHLPPFQAAIEAGVRTVMATYGSWRGTRIHAHGYLLTDVLKNELGFTGFVVTDWMAVEQIDADLPTAIERALLAGIDMVMVPFDYRRFISIVEWLVDVGRVPGDRIDDAVRRILMVKDELDLLEGDPPAPVSLDVVGCEAHRKLAREAAAASTVVLVDGGVLPIPTSTTILTAGAALDDVGISCGGWTISWTGSAGPITEGRTILDGLSGIVGEHRIRHDLNGPDPSESARYGVVSIHEMPYVEGAGDRADLRIEEEQVEIVRRMRACVERLVVIVVSGRPLLIEPIVELADAVVACWLPGSEAVGVADVLCGSVRPRGRLPVRWPRRRSDIGDLGWNDPGPAPWPVGHAADGTPKTGDG